MHGTLTVLMPAYNEAEGISDAVDEARTEILDRLSGAVLLVVDDGSKDNTGAILDEHARNDPRIRVLHKKNGGHGPAIRTGLDAVTTDWVFLVDSDRQIPLSDFFKLSEAVASGHDAAFGVRHHRDDPRLRLVLTAVIRKALFFAFGVRLYDANVPFKLIRRERWEEARKLIPEDTLAPSLFLAVLMKLRKLDVAEIEVQHRERSTGEVSIRRWKLLKFCARAFGQMMAFRNAVRADAVA